MRSKRPFGSRRLAKFYEILSNFSFELNYKPGKSTEMNFPDMLSRAEIADEKDEEELLETCMPVLTRSKARALDIDVDREREERLQATTPRVRSELTENKHKRTNEQTILESVPPRNDSEEVTIRNIQSDESRINRPRPDNISHLEYERNESSSEELLNERNELFRNFEEISERRQPSVTIEHTEPPDCLFQKSSPLFRRNKNHHTEYRNDEISYQERSDIIKLINQRLKKVYDTPLTADILSRAQMNDSYFSKIINYIDKNTLPTTRREAKRIMLESENYCLINKVLSLSWNTHQETRI